MEKEKGIGRDDMIVTISNAIKNAAQKAYESVEIDVEINPRNGKMKAWEILEVVDSVSDPKAEIHIEKAGEYAENPSLGESVRREFDPTILGRIAAQAARQAIKQRVRQFEKELIYNDFKDQIGTIVTGVVRRRERNDLIVEIGKAEAILPGRERIPGEDYSPGERIRCILLDIDVANRGPELTLSRSCLKFVQKLFELEVTEIADGTVRIEGMAREPGYRSKICVSSTDPKVDPVGSCVGARGARVKSIVRELGGEKMDIIRYHEDPEILLDEALKPAVPHNIKIDKAKRRIYFEVDESDLAVAIGKKGQNARLTSKLLGWKLDIEKKEQKSDNFETKLERASRALTSNLGINPELSKRLVESGIVSPEAFDGVMESDLVDAGFSESEAASIMNSVNTAKA
jgi:N utilization substance protein A|tara:strand:+ start:1736 stop:2941 length:1206 start_codon:yes stop_codon:yes gene_type:complete